MSRDTFYKAPAVLVKSTKGYSKVEDKLSWIIALYYFDNRCFRKRLLQRKRVCIVDTIELVYYPFLLKCNNSSCVIIDLFSEEDIVKDHGVIADLVILFNKAFKTYLHINRFMSSGLNMKFKGSYILDSNTEYRIPRIGDEGIYLIPLFRVRYNNGDTIMHPPIFLSEATVFVKGYVGVFRNLERFASLASSNPDVIIYREDFLDTSEPTQVIAVKEEISELSNLLGVLEDELKKKLSPYL